MTTLTAIGAVTNLAQIAGEAITPLATRRIIPGDKMMMVHWEMKKGADSAAHHHPHEQLVYVISGKLKLRVGRAVGDAPENRLDKMERTGTRARDISH